MTGLCCRCQVRHEDELCCSHGIVHRSSNIDAAVVELLLSDEPGPVEELKPAAVYQVSQRTGVWLDVPGGKDSTFDDVERFLLHDQGSSGLMGEHWWHVRNNFNGSVTVVKVTRLPGWRPVLSLHGSADGFYGASLLTSESGRSDMPFLLAVTALLTCAVFACAVIGYGNSDTAKVAAAIAVIIIGAPVLRWALRIEPGDEPRHPAAWQGPGTFTRTTEPEEQS